MVAQVKPQPTKSKRRKGGAAPLPPVPFAKPERMTAKVGKSGPELELAGVTAEDMAMLADATRRAAARKLDFEDRVRFLQARDKTLAGIMAERETADEEVKTLTAKLEAALDEEQRGAGTAKAELPGVVMVTFPAPRMVYKSSKPLAEAYESPILRRAMGITCEPTKLPKLKVKTL